MIEHHFESLANLRSFFTNGNAVTGTFLSGLLDILQVNTESVHQSLQMAGL